MASTGETVGDAAGDNGSSLARLRLLGAVELYRPAPLQFLPERRYRLLAYLALQDGWVARDQLANLFWPDRTQDAARSNFRKLLMEVRRLCVPGLEDSRHALRWQVEHDVAAFARAHAGSDHRAVLALYQGPALQGLDGGDSTAFATWLRGERLRLRMIWRDSVLATMENAPPSAAIELCQRLLEDDRYDEDAVRAHMRALAALGRIAESGRVYKAFAERIATDLSVDVSIETQTLARKVESGKPKPSVTSSVGDAAEILDGFIGRAAEMAELQALLTDPRCRVITVTGPGGMGKSRLVKELMHARSRQVDETVCWIALDDLNEVAQVAPRVARELGLETSALQDAAEVVAGHLAPLNLLLVFDNSEHLPSLGSLIERWLAAAPRLKVLATSRSRIGVDREWLVPLMGLQVPAAGTGVDVLQYEAARLFILRATLAQPRFNVQANASSVANLVRAVGGMPLAILLAAGWVRMLPVAEMASDVTHLLDVLERDEEGDERPEHRSVRATFEQSWRLLSPSEQRLLRVLSVFAGTFTRAAVHEVSQAPLPVLGSLIDKSLVQIDGDARCSLHPLIQQFAADKLAADAPLARAARDQHAASYSHLMGQFGRFSSIDQSAALRTISAELSNILAAWEWAIVQQRGDWLGTCASGLSNYFQARGPLDAGLRLFSRAEAALVGSSATWSEAAWSIPLEYASLNYWRGDYREVEAAGRRALAAARKQKNAYAIRFSLNTLGLSLYRQGQLSKADRYLSEALKRARAERLPDEVASFAGNLVAIKRELGDNVRALALANEALEGHRRNGHLIGELSVLNEIGLLLHSMDQPEQAVEAFEAGLRLVAGSGLEMRRCILLTHCASALLDHSDVDRAQEYCSESLRGLVASGFEAGQPTCRRTLAAIESARGNLRAAREQLIEAITVSRKIATVAAIVPTLREGANFLTRCGDPVAALRLVACAGAHRESKAALIARYRDSADQLRRQIGDPLAASAEAAGAALSLDAALAELSRALDSRA